MDANIDVSQRRTVYTNPSRVEDIPEVEEHKVPLNEQKTGPYDNNLNIKRELIMQRQQEILNRFYI